MEFLSDVNNFYVILWATIVIVGGSCLGLLWIALFSGNQGGGV